MIKREIEEKINFLRSKYAVITLTGARQTGKTTLLKAIYQDLPYVNLEDIDNRKLAKLDPRGFLSNFPKGAVIDEVQQVPTLLSYIQQIVDTKNEVHFALSGSQNFQLLETITQSLAGRTAILTLLPFSYTELIAGGFSFETVEDLIFKGTYPRIYDKQIEANDFYPYYISSYIERDVRQIKNVENLNVFALFLKLVAGRIGQLVNIQSLANDIGISPNTAKAWLSILETSYVLYFHQPHYKNFNKRLIKSPKIYFYDTGLACSLLQIRTQEQLNTHYLKGGLFENFVINEMNKFYINKGQKPALYFWQSKTKKEIDAILEVGTSLYPFEMKASKTKNLHLLDNLNYWKKLNGNPPESLFLIYGGEEDFATSNGRFISWRNISKVLSEID